MLNKATTFFIVALLFIPFSLLVCFLYELGMLYFISKFISSIAIYEPLTFKHTALLAFPIAVLSTIFSTGQILKSCEKITEVLHG